MPRNEDVHFTSSALELPLCPQLGRPTRSQLTESPHFKWLHRWVTESTQLLSKFRHTTPFSPLLCSASLPLSRPGESTRSKPPLLCSASLALAESEGGLKGRTGESTRAESPVLCSASLALTESTQSESEGGGQKGRSSARQDEERVLISEVLVRSKDGEELERKDLESEALAALKACRANSALTVREVQEDVHRIIDSGYFCSCMPVAVDTRDGIRLVFQVEPNQEFHGLVCEGANVLPAKFLEDSFRDAYGKVVNIRRLDEVISSINGWYMERGLFGMVSAVEILSGGIIRLQVSEAEVNNISIRFLDRKTGEPTVGKTKPETILRQLTTKKGQVYSMLQGKRDVDTVLTMGIMEDVSIIPQPAGDTGKVDLTMNCVERVSGGFSAGGGISSGITSGPLSGLIGSLAVLVPSGAE